MGPKEKAVLKPWIIVVAVLMIFSLVVAVDTLFSVRVTVMQPGDNTIYTIGDKTYADAIGKEQRIIKFGPLFFGLYPGGIVFPTVEAAQEYLVYNKLDQAGWGVYRLSGDFKNDTVRRGARTLLNKSLLVLGRAYF